MNVEKLTHLLDRTIEEEGFSGVVQVRQGGKVVYERAAGLASRAYGVKNTPQTRFGTASVTKLFTAVAVMQLIEAGRLGLDTPVVGLLELADTAILPEVTVRHLLTHTSGIGDYFDEEIEEDYGKVWETIPNYQVNSLSDMLRLFIHQAPKHQPGEVVAYSNAAYILLGLVIEKVTGGSYFDYVRENIFRRVDMESSDFLPLDGVFAHLAEGYIPLYAEDGAIAGYRRNIFTLPRVGASDGGAYTTAEDLCRFLQGLREGKLLSVQWMKEILRPRVLELTQEETSFYYGYGIYFVCKGDRVIRYGHPGEDPGFSCRVYHCPEMDLDFAVASNVSEGVVPVMRVILQSLANPSCV